MKPGLLSKTAVLAFASAADFFLAGCQDSTRITGSITLKPGLEAPDSNRHTLYVAAFKSADFTNGVLSSSAVPVFVEFGGISNDDFNPDVTYALGGAGQAEEVGVIAWWKVNDPEHLDYQPPSDGDRYGAYAQNPIFRGQDGTKGGARSDGVDILLDRKFGAPVIAPPHF